MTARGGAKPQQVELLLVQATVAAKVLVHDTD